MTSKEAVSVFLLMLVILIIYAAESLLIARLALAKLRNRPSKFFFSKPALLIHAVAVLGLGCFLYGLLIEPNWPQVTTIKIRTPKLKNTSLRIVQISDTHCDKKLRNEKRLVQIVNSLDPDLIVFTGDALSSGGALPLFKNTMQNLNASVAKLAVRGNFDLNRDANELYSETGFRLLDADSVSLTKNSESFYVTGLAWANPKEFRSLLQNVPGDKFSIFLYHYSDLVEDTNGLNIDLYLSGHTHGGQVRLPLYGALVTLSKFGKKYEAGLYKVGHTTLYVNRGIGLEVPPAPPVRFLCRPEITLFEISPQNRAGDTAL